MRQMNEEIQKRENHSCVCFKFSGSWSLAFHHTLSRRQGDTLDTLPVYQRAIHVDSPTHSNTSGVDWLVVPPLWSRLK